MTIQETVTDTNGTAAPVTETISEAYSLQYTSSSTYKVLFTIGLPGEDTAFTEWFQNDGSLIALYSDGQNLTGSTYQSIAIEGFAGFLAADSSIDPSIYTSSTYFHATGTSTANIGPTQLSVTTYAANTLPENFTNCGVQETLIGFSFSVGTPQGTSATVVTKEYIDASTVVDGQTDIVNDSVVISSLTLTSTYPAPEVWAVGPSYPLTTHLEPGVLGQACVNGTATVYCIGGFGINDTVTSDVFATTISPSGMGDWNTEASYPVPIVGQACVAYGGYAYCIGGQHDGEGDDIASSYYSQMTSTGLGPWESTTAYPVPVDSSTCVASSGYVYCIGGDNETTGTNSTYVQSNTDWYASVSSSGIGTWKETTAYPTGADYPSCGATATEIYCTGGFNSTYSGVSNSYYAPISSSGIGSWSSTTAYPVKGAGQSCNIDSGDIICVGGLLNYNDTAYTSVYYAPVTSGGIGPWQQSSATLPLGMETICTVVNGGLYCTGGYADPYDYWTDFTFYAAVDSLI
jgi:hypothetical protein